MPTRLASLPDLARRHALALWLALVLAATVVTVRTHYVADLSAFLPRSPSAEQAVLLDQLKNGIAARLVMIGIEGGTPGQRAAASRAYADTLRKTGLFDAVHNGDNAEFEATGRFLFEHRYLLSPAVNAERFSVDGLRAGIDEATSLLGTPAGSAIKGIIFRDPTGETVRMAESMLPSQAPASDGGVWVSRSAPRAVLVATTHADGGDLDAQEQALQRLRSDFQPYAAQGLRLVVSGAGSFAVASRATIKAEVEHLAIAGGVAIIALLLLAFGGSLRTLLTALLPVATGVLAGIAVVSLVHGNVHGITLGFGTTLIGEAVDYAIYYLIQARPAPGAARGAGARRWIAGSWPTVRLGLWTSLGGFAALLFSGFPGLAQLGLFSIAGLTAAALTTRWVFVRLAPDGAPGRGLRHHLGDAVGAATRVLPRLRWPLVALMLAAAAALALLPSGWQGNISSLSPIGAEAMQRDAELRADIGASDSGVLIALSAPSESEALAAAEAAGARLDALVDAGTIAGYESPARLLPSPALQAARQKALPDAETLRRNLAEATVDGPLPLAKLDDFIRDVQAERTLPLLTLASLRGTPLAAALDALLVRGDGERPWRALLSLQPGAKPLDVDALRRAVAGLPGARVVSIKPELDALYTRYLHEASVQALLGALLVLLLLAGWLRSARRLFWVVLPVAGAVAIVLAGLTLAGKELGILHLVGLLLTVAIGSNYALFFDQLRHAPPSSQVGALADLAAPHPNPLPRGPREQDNDTYASLALANLTAVISFGLLAFSSIPALYAIGQVVAPGIALSLILSAALITPRPAAGRPGDAAM